MAEITSDCVETVIKEEPLGVESNIQTGLSTQNNDNSAFHALTSNCERFLTVDFNKERQNAAKLGILPSVQASPNKNVEDRAKLLSSGQNYLVLKQSAAKNNYGNIKIIKRGGKVYKVVRKSAPVLNYVRDAFPQRYKHFEYNPDDSKRTEVKSSKANCVVEEASKQTESELAGRIEEEKNLQEKQARSEVLMDQVKSALRVLGDASPMEICCYLVVSNASDEGRELFEQLQNEVRKLLESNMDCFSGMSQYRVAPYSRFTLIRGKGSLINRMESGIQEHDYCRQVDSRSAPADSGRAKRIYQCNTCVYSTTRRSIYKKHVQSLSACSRYLSKDDKTNTTASTSVDKPVPPTSSQPAKIYCCIDCDYESLKKEVLKSHYVSKHLFISPVKLDESISTPHVIKRRRRWGRRRRVCERVDEDNTSEGCKEITSSDCGSEADKDQKKADSLVKSAQSISASGRSSSQIVLYSCNSCGYSMVINGEKLSENNSKYSCSECNFSSSTRAQLNYHTKAFHSSEGFKCARCGFVEKKSKVADDEVEKSTDEDPSAKIVKRAKMCDESFKEVSDEKRSEDTSGIKNGQSKDRRTPKKCEESSNEVSEFNCDGGIKSRLKNRKKLKTKFDESYSKVTDSDMYEKGVGEDVVGIKNRSKINKKTAKCEESSNQVLDLDEKSGSEDIDGFKKRLKITKKTPKCEESSHQVPDLDEKSGSEDIDRFKKRTKITKKTPKSEESSHEVLDLDEKSGSEDIDGFKKRTKITKKTPKSEESSHEVLDLDEENVVKDADGIKNRSKSNKKTPKCEKSSHRVPDLDEKSVVENIDGIMKRTKINKKTPKSEEPSQEVLDLDEENVVKDIDGIKNKTKINKKTPESEESSHEDLDLDEENVVKDADAIKNRSKRKKKAPKCEKSSHQVPYLDEKSGGENIDGIKKRTKINKKTPNSEESSHKDLDLDEENVVKDADGIKNRSKSNNKTPNCEKFSHRVLDLDEKSGGEDGSGIKNRLKIKKETKMMKSYETFSKVPDNDLCEKGVCEDVNGINGQSTETECEESSLKLLDDDFRDLPNVGITDRLKVESDENSPAKTIAETQVKRSTRIRRSKNMEVYQSSAKHLRKHVEGESGSRSYRKKSAKCSVSKDDNDDVCGTDEVTQVDVKLAEDSSADRKSVTENQESVGVTDAPLCVSTVPSNLQSDDTNKSAPVGDLITFKEDLDDSFICDDRPVLIDEVEVGPPIFTDSVKVREICPESDVPFDFFIDDLEKNLIGNRDLIMSDFRCSGSITYYYRKSKSKRVNPIEASSPISGKCPVANDKEFIDTGSPVEEKVIPKSPQKQKKVDGVMVKVDEACSLIDDDLEVIVEKVDSDKKVKLDISLDNIISSDVKRKRKQIISVVKRKRRSKVKDQSLISNDSEISNGPDKLSNQLCKTDKQKVFDTTSKVEGELLVPYGTFVNTVDENASLIPNGSDLNISRAVINASRTSVKVVDTEMTLQQSVVKYDESVDKVSMNDDKMVLFDDVQLADAVRIPQNLPLTSESGDDGSLMIVVPSKSPSESAEHQIYNDGVCSAEENMVLQEAEVSTTTHIKSGSCKSDKVVDAESTETSLSVVSNLVERASQDRDRSLNDDDETGKSVNANRRCTKSLRPYKNKYKRVVLKTYENKNKRGKLKTYGNKNKRRTLVTYKNNNKRATLNDSSLKTERQSSECITKKISSEDQLSKASSDGVRQTTKVDGLNLPDNHVTPKVLKSRGRSNGSKSCAGKELKRSKSLEDGSQVDETKELLNASTTSHYSTSNQQPNANNGERHSRYSVRRVVGSENIDRRRRSNLTVSDPTIDHVTESIEARMKNPNSKKHFARRCTISSLRKVDRVLNSRSSLHKSAKIVSAETTVDANSSEHQLDPDASPAEVAENPGSIDDSCCEPSEKLSKVESSDQMLTVSANDSYTLDSQYPEKSGDAVRSTVGSNRNKRLAKTLETKNSSGLERLSDDFEANNGKISSVDEGGLLKLLLETDNPKAPLVDPISDGNRLKSDTSVSADRQVKETHKRSATNNDAPVKTNVTVSRKCVRLKSILDNAYDSGVTNPMDLCDRSDRADKSIVDAGGSNGSSSIKLTNSLKSVTPRKQTLDCPVCELSFKYKKMFQKHLTRCLKPEGCSTRDEFGLNCARCSLKFATSPKLVEHIREAHSQTRLKLKGGSRTRTLTYNFDRLS